MQSKLSLIRRIREKNLGKLKNTRAGLKLEVARLEREIRRTQGYIRHPVTLAIKPKDARNISGNIAKMTLELKNKKMQLTLIERKLSK